MSRIKQKRKHQQKWIWTRKGRILFLICPGLIAGAIAYDIGIGSPLSITEQANTKTPAQRGPFSAREPFTFDISIHDLRQL